MNWRNGAKGWGRISWSLRDYHRDRAQLVEILWKNTTQQLNCSICHRSMEVLLTFQRNVGIKLILKPHRSLGEKEHSNLTSFSFLIHTAAAILNSNSKPQTSPGVYHVLFPNLGSLYLYHNSPQGRIVPFSPSSPTCRSHRILKSTVKSLFYMQWEATGGLQQERDVIR